MDSLWQDARLALRSLRRDPGLSAAVVLTLAIGLGLNVLVFSVVSAVLLKPFPFPWAQQERLVILWEQDLARDDNLHEVSFPNFRDWRARSESFDDMAAMGSTFWGRYRFAGGSEPFTGTVRAVSFSFFDTLGARPHRGRTFLPGDDEPGAAPVIVVSHGFWRSHLGGDPGVVGRSLPLLDGGSATVAGVMPPAFDYPPGTEIWAPVGAALAEIAARRDFTPAEERGLGVLFVIGRLKHGIGIEAAEAEMTAIVQRLREQYSPDTGASPGVHVMPLVEHLLGTTRPALYALWGAVILVLLLVCANVAGLLLAREASRATDYALRLALGAGRLRILRHVLAEAALVTGAGAVLGLALAHGGLLLFTKLNPYETPRIENAALSPDVLLFGIALVAITICLVGIATALPLASRDIAPSLGDAARGSSASRGSARLRRLLVAAQITLALVVLVGAGLMARSFLELLDAELGFEPRNVLALNLSLSEERYATHASKRAFYRDLIGRIESLPDVVAVAGVNPRPFLHGPVGNDWAFYVEGQSPENGSRNPRANAMVVSAAYFRAMNIRLLEGRTFTEHDDDRAEPVVVVSESLARYAWPGQNPIGKRLCCGLDENRERRWLTVIGVVENAKSRDVHAPRLDLYEHYLQGWSSLPSILVRTGSDPRQHAGAIREQVRAVDPQVPVEEITTMDAVIARVYAPWRFNTISFGAFAAVALGLAAIGLFGLLAFDVRRRTREIGVRMALGATRERILRLVLRQAAFVVLPGAAGGIAGSVVLSRVLTRLLYGVGPTDVPTYVVMSAVLLATALLATYIPARQAMRVDPGVALRHE